MSVFAHTVIRTNLIFKGMSLRKPVFSYSGNCISENSGGMSPLTLYIYSHIANIVIFTLLLAVIWERFWAKTFRTLSPA